MTKEEFLEYIDRNSLPGEWELVPSKYRNWNGNYFYFIRNKQSGECPICWVATKENVNTYADKEYTTHVSKKLGLPLIDNCDIVDAADEFYLDREEIKHLRLRLEKVCKL